MKTPFTKGDKKNYEHTVKQADFATFPSGTVHEVYATFALARDAEWSGRLFVLEMKDKDEEGIGTFLSVNHVSPSFENERVVFESILVEVRGNEVTTDWQARVGERLIAEGTQKQKILKKSKVNALFEGLKHTHKNS